MSFKIDQIPSCPLLVFHGKEQRETWSGGRGAWTGLFFIHLTLSLHDSHSHSHPVSSSLPSTQKSWDKMVDDKCPMPRKIESGSVQSTSGVLWLPCSLSKGKEPLWLVGQKRPALYEKKKNEVKEVGETRKSDFNYSYHLLNVSTVPGSLYVSSCFLLLTA